MFQIKLVLYIVLKQYNNILVMEKETNLTLYNLFDEIDLDSNTSIDLSNEESIEEITLDDFENFIDHIDVNVYHA